MAGDKWGVTAAWQERWRGQGHDPCPAMDKPTCEGGVHVHLLQEMEPTEEAPEGMAITLACEGWLRFRQAESGEKPRWTSIWCLTRPGPGWELRGGTFNKNCVKLNSKVYRGKKVEHTFSSSKESLVILWMWHVIYIPPLSLCTSCSLFLAFPSICSSNTLLAPIVPYISF